MINTTAEIRIYELLSTKFNAEASKELVSEIKSLTNNDLLDRVDDKFVASEARILSSLTWRLLFFFMAQIGFTIGLIQFIK